MMWVESSLLAQFPELAAAILARRNPKHRDPIATAERDRGAQRDAKLHREEVRK